MVVVIFLIVLGFLVLVHELGHFLVAKRNGVGAEEFGLGFPPRIAGFYRNRKKRWAWVWGNKQVQAEIKERDETVYSINAIPLGGFVKIVGEDGDFSNDPKSFSNKNAWIRFKILSAGVAMNVFFGFLLFVAAYKIGLPEAIDDENNDPSAKVQIGQVIKGSPADQLGLEIGDQVVSFNGVKIENISQLQDLIKQNAGQSVKLEIEKTGEQKIKTIDTVLRENAPVGEGILGVLLVKTVFKENSLLESIKLALVTTFSIIISIFVFLWELISGLFKLKPVPTEVSGPVGIAIMTGQMAKMGIAYLLHFAGLLSINLAVINFLPLPALDGGRILFLLIEKIKGNPVNQKLEGIIHTAGFFVLLLLMFLVTIKDFSSIGWLEKISSIF